MIYFALASEVARVKIGFTTGKATYRITCMQVGSPVEIALLAVMAGDKETEASLHQRFRAFKCRGEWFRFEGELSEFIKSLKGYTAPSLFESRQAIETIDEMAIRQSLPRGASKSFMTVQEAATMLSVGDAQILALIQRGYLPARNIATGVLKPRWRIDRADFEVFLQSRSSRPPATVSRRRRNDMANVTQYV